MDKHEGETDCKAGESTVAVAGVGYPQDHHQKYEGKNSFHEEGSAGREGEIAFTGCLCEISSETVGCEYAGIAETCTGPYGIEDTAGESGSDELCCPVDEHLLEGHSAVYEYAETDGGVQMRTGDMTDSVCHGYYGKTESDSNTEKSDMAEQGCTAAAQYEYSSSEEFCKEFIACFHNK